MPRGIRYFSSAVCTEEELLTYWFIHLRKTWTCFQISVVSKIPECRPFCWRFKLQHFRASTDLSTFVVKISCSCFYAANDVHILINVFTIPQYRDNFVDVMVGLLCNVFTAYKCKHLFSRNHVVWIAVITKFVIKLGF